MIDLWLAILEPLRQWDNEDIANLQRAFIAVAREVEEWPAPKAVINKLEPKVKVSKLNLSQPTQTLEDKEKIQAILKECREMLEPPTPYKSRSPEGISMMRTKHDKFNLEKKDEKNKN